ncbi:MAG: hypothetical protein ACE37H_02595 [Phycisphaeraceae bacterium]
MDELDHNLLMAWNRVFERCRRDPREARRRYDRVAAGRTFDRPNRAWCVAVRASDTRLDTFASADDPAAVRARLTHEIVLDGGSLRGLGGPVFLPYPGVPIDVAADRLGKHKEALRSWMPVRSGRTRAARAEAGKAGGLDDRLVWSEHQPTAEHPLGVRFEPQRSLGRNSGMETPVVWCDGALDPGASRGRPPSAWWGLAWMTLAERIPQGFEQGVVREPRWIGYRNEGERFRGWWWRCPGLVATGAGCGRRVQVLYAPLPAWTIGRALGIEDGLDVEGLSGRWLPGVMDRWAGRRSLACERCWRIRRTTMTNATGWNDLVTHLSGGLLYGREVAKPVGFEHERKRAYRGRGGRRRRRRADALGVDQSMAV